MARQSPLDLLGARIAALEAQLADIPLDALPIAQLQTKLLQSWQPDGSLLLGTGTALPDNSVTTSMLVDAAVTGAKLANNSVYGAAIINSVVTWAKIAAGEIHMTGSTSVVTDVAGAGAVVVTHGLVATPTFVGIETTSHSAIDHRVSAKTSATFTVVFSGGPVSTTVNFDWAALR